MYADCAFGIQLTKEDDKEERLPTWSLTTSPSARQMRSFWWFAESCAGHALDEAEDR